MSGNNITLGIRLTADGKGLVGEVKLSREEIEKLGKSERSAASEAGKLNEAHKSLASTLLKTTGIAGGLYFAVTRITDVVLALPKAGIDFAAQMETSRLGMAGILSSMTTMNGKPLEFNRALAISSDYMRKLNDDALRTAATSQELVTAFQALLAPGIAAKMNLEQIRELTVTGVNAVKSIGLGTQQVVQELRDLVAGGITPASSTLATALGLKDEDIKKAKESSQGLFAFLMERMKGFEESSQRFGDTFQGRLSALKEGATRVAAEGFSPLFEFIKDSLGKLSDKFIAFEKDGDKIKSIKLNQDFVSSLQTASEAVIKLTTAIEPAAKIAAAYFAVFVAAPAILGATVTAWNMLALAAAVTNFNMKAGTTILELMNTTLWGTTLSATAATGALGVLKIAGGSLFAAFAGWQIGSWLRDNFVEARVAGLSFVGAMMKGWESLKYGASVAIAWLQSRFVELQNTAKSFVGVFMDMLANVASHIPGSEKGAEAIRAYAKSIKDASNESTGYAAAKSKLDAEYQREIAAIDDNITGLVAYELQAGNAAKTTDKLAGSAVNLAPKFKTMSEEAKKLAEEIGKATRELQARAMSTFLEASFIRENGEKSIGTEYFKAFSETVIGKFKKAGADGKAAFLKAARLSDSAAAEKDFELYQKQLDDEARKADNEYAKQKYETVISSTQELNDESRRLGAEMIVDDKARALALLEIEKEKWQRIIALAKEGSDEQKNAQNAYQNWLNNKLANADFTVWKKHNDKINSGLTDALMRGFEAGKGFAQNFFDSLKNMAKTLVLRPVISFILNPISGAITTALGGMGIPGMANAAGGASGGVGGGSFGSGWLSNDWGNNVVNSKLGSMTGLSQEHMVDGIGTGQYFPTDLGSSAASAMNIGGQVLGYANAIMAARDGQWGKALGTAVGTYFGGPIGSFIGSTIGGFVDDMFGGGGGDKIGASNVYRMGANGKTVADSVYSPSGGDALGAGAIAQGALNDINATAISLGGKLKNTLLQIEYELDPKGSAPGSVGFMVNGKRTAWEVNGQDVQGGAAQIKIAAQRAYLQGLQDLDIGGGIDAILESVKAASATPEEISSVIQLAGAFRQIKDLMPEFGKASVETIKALADAAGGAAALQQQVGYYYQNFYTDAERLKAAQGSLSEQFKDMGINTVPATRDEFRKLMEAQDLSTESGRTLYAALLKIAPAFVSVADASAQAAAAAKTAALDAAADAVAAAKTDLIDAYQRELDAKQALMDKMRGYVASLSQFRQSLLIGDLSPLSPGAKYDEARRQYDDVSRRAALGDTSAIEQLQGVSQAYLEVSRAYNASSEAYSRDFSLVQSALANTESVAERQARIAADAVSVARRQLDYLREINRSVLTIPAAIDALARALAAQSAVKNPEAEKAVDGKWTSTGGASITIATDSTPSVITDKTGATYTTQQAIDWVNTRVAANDPMSIYNEVVARGISANTLGVMMGWNPVDLNAWAIGQGLPTFAVGTSYVPQDMTARIHAGEEITPRPYVDRQAAERQQTNAELKEQTAELRRQTAELRDTRNVSVDLLTRLEARLARLEKALGAIETETRLRGAA